MPTPNEPGPQVTRLAELPCDRTVTMTREAINVEARTVELSFASEEPYQRWWGTEILSMDRSAVRLGRLAGGQHPLLVNHCPDDQVGVVERAWIGDDRRARAIVRFGRSEDAQEIFQDVQDGIRSLVSVGYRIHEAKLAKSSDQGDNDEYLITDWEPYEISIVSIPADPTVGVGRGMSRTDIRSLFTGSDRSNQQQQSKELSLMGDTTDTKSVEPDLKKSSADGAAAERQRIRDIGVLGKKFGRSQADIDKAIDDGTSYDAFREAVFSGLEQSGALRLADAGEIGLSKKERQQFRFTNLIAATIWPEDAAVRKMAAFEIDASRAAADKRLDVRTERQGAFCVPVDVLTGPLDMRMADAEMATSMLMQRMRASGTVGQRDLVVGTASAGGNLVATELLGSSFIDLLVNRLSVMSMGATMLTGLQGNIAIPRATGGSTGYWLGENSAATESQQSFDQVALSPKTAGAMVDYGRRLLMQSSIAVEAFVRMDIARTLSLMIDAGALTGTGASNQPRGLLNTVGIGSVVGGTNGAAPTWDNIVDLESAVATANADGGSLGYLTNSKVRGKLKRTQQFTGTNGAPVWQGNELNGTRAIVSNQVPSNLTKGTSAGICSAIAYGNWSDMLIALWGGLDIMVDPYTGSSAGTRRIVALQDVDVSVRYPQSFAVMLDALTT